MIELTGKQKRFLRAAGQKLAATCIIGKAGLTDQILANIGRDLDRHELVKIRLPACPPPERKALAAQVAERLGAACVGMIGRTALLYRPNPDIDADRRLALP